MTTGLPIRRLSAVAGSVRTLAAWALLTYAGLTLLFVTLHWLWPNDTTGIADRSHQTSFATVVTLAAPILAVLLATAVGTAVATSRLIALTALAEYAVLLILGTLAWLLGLGGAADSFSAGVQGTLDGLSYVLIGLVQLALAAIAALAVWRVNSRS